LFAGPGTSCAQTECQHAPINISLDQGSDVLIFQKFDTLGGTRALLKVVVQSNVQTFHGIEYTLKSDHQSCLFESGTEANFLITLTGSFVNAGPLQQISPIFRRSTGFGLGGLDHPRYCGNNDPIDEIVLCPVNPVNCTPPPACPPSCNYGGTFSYFGCDAANITNPNDVVQFNVVNQNNTFMLSLVGGGFFAAAGSEFVFSNVENHALGDTFVAYVFAPTGACCLPDGSCTPQVTEDECDAVNGTWFEGQTCGTDGACCLPNGTCISMPQICCTAQGGSFVDGACSTDNGACCLPNGTCIIANQTCCTLLGGTFQGNASVCFLYQPALSQPRNSMALTTRSIATM
jgi:hypothetical protein